MNEIDVTVNLTILMFTKLIKYHEVSPNDEKLLIFKHNAKIYLQRDYNVYDDNHKIKIITDILLWYV